MFLKIARNLFNMHPSINDASCVCLIGGVGGGQLEGFRAHRTMHCFLKLQEPRYEMGPIPMTLDMPNTLQLAACQEVILAVFSRSQKAQGSHFYLLSISSHFLNCPSNRQLVGPETSHGNRQDTWPELGEVGIDRCPIYHS